MDLGQSGLNLSALVRELKGVKWFDLGIQLGICKAQLKFISQQHCDQMRCLTEMLNVWLETNPFISKLTILFIAN